MSSIYLSNWNINRRTLLSGAAGLAASSVVLRSRSAKAAGRVIVGTWGGDYAIGLRDSIDVQMGEAGYEIIQDANTTAARNGKLFAEKDLPVGSLDIACVQPGAALEMAAAGLLEPLSVENIPNLAFVQPELNISEYMASHIFSPTVLLYNADTSDAPTSLGDMIDPKYKDKFAVTSNYRIIVMAASLYAGGDIHAIEEGKTFCEKLSQNGMQFYSADMMAQPLMTGEILVGMLPMARAVMWQNAGMNIQGAYPSEGTIPYLDGFVVPKNAPNKEGAFKYIDMMLTPFAQQKFAEFMAYMPSTTNAGLSGKIAEQLALPDPLPKIVIEDYEFTSQVQAELGDWWQKVILR